MTDYNKIALDTLERISSHFETELKRYEPINSDFSVGIEVEIKFQYYFPEIFEKYFKNKSWKNYSKDEQKIISSEITVIENITNLREKLYKTQELGIVKGLDCYWEFALDPVTDLSILLTQLELLKDLDLIPKGNHSLHITIGNKAKNESIHWVLLLCEMLLSSPERIVTGFNKEKRVTYFKKGESGLLEKRWRLVDCPSAIEFRSLELVVDNDKDISLTISKLQYISKLLNNVDFLNNEIDKCKVVLGEYDLPNTNWKNYKNNPDIWDRYYDNFTNIKSELIKQ